MLHLLNFEGEQGVKPLKCEEIVLERRVIELYSFVTNLCLSYPREIWVVLNLFLQVRMEYHGPGNKLQPWVLLYGGAFSFVCHNFRQPKTLWEDSRLCAC